MAQRGKVQRIHHGKTPVRVHYIPEWAEVRGKRQADFARDLDIDKSTVKRWFDGTIPVPETLPRVAAYLQLEDERMLFRHPDDDWLARFFHGREQTEVERIRQTLETAFPRRAGDKG